MTRMEGQVGPAAAAAAAGAAGGDGDDAPEKPMMRVTAFRRFQTVQKDPSCQCQSETPARTPMTMMKMTRMKTKSQS